MFILILFVFLSSLRILVRTKVLKNYPLMYPENDDDFVSLGCRYPDTGTP